MGQVKHKIMVLSGKGGVGKSTVAVNLAMSLANSGKTVGLMDIDVHGPSIPKLLRLSGVPAYTDDRTILPIPYQQNMKVMSMGFFLPGPDEAIIWRGPMKHTLIRQFLSDVDWGVLDYLVIDSPPGTGDEPLSIANFLGKETYAVVVTTPQELSTDDVRKSINFCRQVGFNIVGVVENMSGFVCPHCNESVEIFKKGGGEKMAKDMNVPFLGRIPVEPKMVAACDNGIPFTHQYPESATAKTFEEILKPILALEDQKMDEPVKNSVEPQNGKARIVLPVAEGKLSMHFGHCEQFIMLDVDLDNKNILHKEFIDAPPHQPGLLPKWLHERGANIIIAGGMGARAQDLFHQNGIATITGAPPEDPEQIVVMYMDGQLQTGDNVCDH
jgi:Mrp family chromosome partitioning ATPase/predicted Fe-Mo cluster-binding NifX family protein